MEQYDLIVNQPVVIDNGSGVIKAGFAGDQVPKCHFPNYIGRPKHTRVMAGALEGDLFVGPKAQEHRGLLSIRYPMEHGIVTGQSLSEALIFASTNSQYDDRLFIELLVQYMKIPSSEHVVYRNCFDIQNNFCTQHVLQK